MKKIAVIKKYLKTITNMKETITIISLAVLLIISVLFGMFSASYMYDLGYKDAGNKIDTIMVYPDLSDEQLLTLAIAGVESEYDNTAVSVCGASGILQLTPIYVAEYNRLSGDSISYHEAIDNPATALHIYNYLSNDKTPEEIIQYHNPKAGKWYAERVRRQFEYLKRYEELRTLIILGEDDRD